MSFLRVIWDLDDDEIGNVRHIEEHGLTKEDVEKVFAEPLDLNNSRSTGRPMAFGYALDGRYIGVVYEIVDSDSVYPVTAYEIEE